MDYLVKIRELELQIEELPPGYITRKKINNRIYHYHQWKENGKTKSHILKTDEIQSLQEQIDQRKLLQKQLKDLQHMSVRESAAHPYRMTPVPDYQMHVLYGSDLKDMVQAVDGWEKRDCFSIVDDYIHGESYDRVCLIYGLRRTGKTTIIKQILSEMRPEELAGAVYMKAVQTDTMASLNMDLKRLRREGFRYFFIDEVTLMQDFVDSAGLLSDVYAAQGIKIVLSGTDSLGFYFAIHEELYDRAVMVHTTFIPFREHSRLLRVGSIDEYIRYGGTLRAGETAFEDHDANAADASFRDDESTRRYIDTAICKNIQHSLACYEGGQYFRHLKELCEAGELTNAINRIIQNMNHDFTVKVVTEQFKSRDLRSAAQLLRGEKDESKRSDVLDRIDTTDIVNGLKRILEIWDREDQEIAVWPVHLEEIKEYLHALDLTETIEIETPSGNGEPIEHVIFTQPGMRFCQVQTLVYLLMKDVQFRKLAEREKKLITEKILDDVRGIMLEDITLLEMKKSLSDRYLVCKLRFAAGEYDMVVYDREQDQCDLYEIKHSKEMDAHQWRHLLDVNKIRAVENRFGKVAGRYILYTGSDKDLENGIHYRNVESFLKSIG